MKACRAGRFAGAVALLAASVGMVTAARAQSSLAADGPRSSGAVASPPRRISSPDEGHAGHPGSAGPDARAAVPVVSFAATVTTDGGSFELTLSTEPDPVRLNEYFELVVSVRSIADGADDDSFWVGVDATMPAHRHGMNTAPVRTNLGSGRFSFSGMLLHMAGDWSIALEVAQGRRRERAVVPLTLAVGEPLAWSDSERATLFTLSPLPPAPLDPTNAVDGDPTAIELGRTLFFDTRLSGDGRTSCASCHDPSRDWADGRQLAIGTSTGRRNTPSLWNVADHRWFFWDGRADSLWSQALKPIEDPVEMNGSRLAVTRLLRTDPDLLDRYRRLFGALPAIVAGDANAAGDADATGNADAAGDAGGDASSLSAPLPGSGGPLALDAADQLNWWSLDNEARDGVNRVFSNVGKALAAFVATLRSPPTPFDEFVADLRGGAARSTAITPVAQHGLKLFIGRGNCVLCHSGPTLTNKEFHDIRVSPPEVLTDAGEPALGRRHQGRAEPGRPARSRPDLGRFEGIDSLVNDEFIAAGPYSDAPESTRALQLAFIAMQTGVIGHFRTPGLRNVAKTAPYMHAGQLATLDDVVRHYATLADAAPPMDPAHIEFLVERPLGLTPDEIDAVVAFLESLTSAG